MSIVRTLAGSLIAAALLGAPVSAFAQTRPAQPKAAAPAISQAMRNDFRRGFIEGSDGMMRYFIEDFPAEYEAFETEMLTAALQGKSMESIRPRIVEVMQTMTPRLYEGHDKAPDAELLAWTRTQVVLGKALLPVDPKTCRRLMEGEALSPQQHQVLQADARTKDPVRRYVHASLDAARAGRRGPVVREQAVASDMLPVIAAYRAAGGEEDWLDVVATPELEKMSDERRCRNNIIWTEAILTQPPAMAARIVMTD